MSQRESGYTRVEFDNYETPEWVTLALLPHLPDLTDHMVWEPASGSGKMANVLCQHDMDVRATDIIRGGDFMRYKVAGDVAAIITNPPYTLACEFITHALELMKPGGLVAMLLRTDFDHAQTRRYLFKDCPQFAKKIVLTRRIQWFEGSTGSPSFNHAWFLWDWTYRGPPMLAYGP